MTTRNGARYSPTLGHAPRSISAWPDWVESAWRLLVHLRLPFQLTLAPVFLWGWLLAGGSDLKTFALAFAAVHICLYGGVTAFNSYYDRDQGPVGGLERPPPIQQALLPLSLLVQAVGLLLAGLLNLAFGGIYVAFAALAAAYSHPRVRLKNGPVRSVVAVAVGQGILAFLGAWAAARGEIGSALAVTGLLGAAAATLIVVGFYPLTQVFQVEEDRARGDRTLAVAWGTPVCLRLGVLGQALGGGVMVTLVVIRYGPADGLLLLAGLAIQLTLLVRWARRFESGKVLANYRWVMRLAGASAAGTGLYLAGRLLLGPG